MKKSHSSKQWLRRHVNDPYVQRSKRDGYRSRSAYKLTEIDDRDHILAPGIVVVDLGSAPGGWSQVAVKRVGAKGRVLAIDLLPMETVSGARGSVFAISRLPMELFAGVEFVQGDFTRKSGLESVRRIMGDRPVDVVLSDMAPNLSGIPVSDQARSMELAELARDFAVLHLQAAEGVFLVKVFQGAGYDEYLKSLRAAFRKVLVRKPDASRDESAEQYLLARGLKSRAAPEL